LAGEWHPSIDRVLAVLSGGKPKSHREIVEATGLSDDAVWSALKRCWRKGVILRSEKPLREPYRAFKGRAGVRRNLRSYHLYVKAPERKNTLIIDGIRFVGFEEGKPSGEHQVSKARLILDFLAGIKIGLSSLRRWLRPSRIRGLSFRT
jgi:DNA-binding Lrp family transcriptional regulator